MRLAISAWLGVNAGACFVSDRACFTNYRACFNCVLKISLGRDLINIIREGVVPAGGIITL